MGGCFSEKKEDKRIKDYIIEEKIEVITTVGLKIHICGKTQENRNTINDIFKDELNDIKYKKRATHQFRNNQFYWISKTYPDLSENTVDSIVNEIVNDTDLPEESDPITQQVIMCFGVDNIELLIDKVKKNGEIYFPLFIIISEEKDADTINKIKFKEKRRITNIILNEKTRKKLNSRIISVLWKYDCYYNERGNKICRYTPDSMFKSFDIDLPFYSINILLTGKSRSGKSTFINYLSNKLDALESCKKETVSKKITEYCLYLNNNKNKNIKPSCIRIFDMPGIVSIKKINDDLDDNKSEKKNAIKNVNENNENKNIDSKEMLSVLLNTKNNNMDKQIHFVLFFFMEGDSLEGIEEIFELLNNCEMPVFFVINKAMSEDDDGRSKDIASTISFLKQKNFNNLIDEKNYFGINLVSSKYFPDFGVNDIFKRIYELFLEKNKLKEKNTEINKDINDLCNKYKRLYDKPLEIQNEDDNFKGEVAQLKKKLNENYDLFNYINIKNIKRTGIVASNICRRLINSLGNLSEIMPDFEENENEIKIPAISYFQAFMVREIGEIFGFNIEEINRGIDDRLKQKVSSLDLDIFNINKKKKPKGKEEEKIEHSLDIISNYLKSEYEKLNDNKYFIINLAKIFNELRKDEIKLEKKNEKLNLIDENLTNGIFIETVDYFIEILEKSNGLFFWKNYLNIYKQLEEDLKYFSELDYKKQWGKKEMIIIND